MTFSEELYDADARIAGMFPVQGLSDIESPPEWVGDLCEDVDGLDGSIIEAVPCLKHFQDGDRCPESWELADALLINGVGGFFVQSEWHCRQYHAENMWSSGWGLYRTQWFHANDLEHAVKQTVEAAKAEHDKALEEWRQKSAA